MDNIILQTDSYKCTHWKQYPPGTEKVYSYFESRGGKFNSVVFFGLQYIIAKYLSGRVVTQEKIDEAKDFYDKHLGPGLFNEDGWKRILKVHGGYLPVSIKAVPEGTVVPNGNVMMTIENTDPELFWLTNWLETLLVQVWYPTTVATISRECKKLILAYLRSTGDPSLIDFKLHDFGFRGVSSTESAEIGGLAHLVNFMGTDNVASLWAARKYYDSDMAGFSIPASEHSTITSWGQKNEGDAFGNMLEQFNDNPLIACVSDSYNIYDACEKLWGGTLKDKVLSHDGTLVIRPDSGEPVVVIKRVLELLWDEFGGSENDKGFKVLDPHVRVIQGDGVNLESIKDILLMMSDYGWSADNVGFGMGGALLQDLNRDTQQFAFKCSSITVNGKERDVWKKPVTDPGKNSKRGRLKLVELNGADKFAYETVEENDPREDQLQSVFDTGTIFGHQSLDQIRDKVSQY